MNKTELIDAMAADAGITKAAAKKALESFLGNVEGSLKAGNRVSLVGFGSWSVSQRSAREGRNPRYPLSARSLPPPITPAYFMSGNTALCITEALN